MAIYDKKNPDNFRKQITEDMILLVIRQMLVLLWVRMPVEQRSVSKLRSSVFELVERELVPFAADTVDESKLFNPEIPESLRRNPDDEV